MIKLLFGSMPDTTMVSNPNDGITTDIVNGIMTVKVDFNATSESSNSFANGLTNAVTTKINSIFGVTNPSDLANHVLYCLPPDSFQGIAYADFGGWRSVYKDENCNNLSAQMHEVSGIRRILLFDTRDNISPSPYSFLSYCAHFRLVIILTSSIVEIQ